MSDALKKRVAAVKTGEKPSAVTPTGRPVDQPAKPPAKQPKPRPPEEKFRLPDKTEFHAVYDAAAKNWKISLKVGEELFVAEGTSLHHTIRMLGKSYNRAHPAAAADPPSPSPASGQAEAKTTD